jgi:hypothetical protein
LVRKELKIEDPRRRKERAQIYGEIAQPRSHLLKERLIPSDHTVIPSCFLSVHALGTAPISVYCDLPTHTAGSSIKKAF